MDLSNFSLLYGIIALALFVFILILCTFLIICYFRCIAKKTRNQQQQQQQLQNFSNSHANEGFQISDSALSTNDELNTTKPPVYDNILNYSSTDKLPTYNSYRKAKERNDTTVVINPAP